jgi:transcriptional regulator with XRE-family HTH domain
MNEIILQIKNTLKNQNISETSAAKMAGVKQDTVNRMLSGKTKKPDLSVIQKLQNALGIVSEQETIYAASRVMEAVSRAEAEALRIMRECPEALAVVQMMGAVDSDTQKDIQRIAETEKRTFEKLQLLQELKKA